MQKENNYFQNHDTKYFKKYGKTFQEKIFQSFLTDSGWTLQMVEVMDPGYFELNYLKFLTQKYFSYQQKYKTFPTLPILLSIVKDSLKENKDLVLRDQIVDFLQRMRLNPDIGDLGYVKDQTLDFCKRQAFKEALEKAVEDIDEGKFDSIVDRMKSACSVGLPSTVGHDFFKDMDTRFVKINRAACPTGLKEIDQKDILNGGLGKGEIGVITANTGVGKSHFLVGLGAEAVRRGKNVVHYTFELSENAVGLRFDSNLCGIPSNEVVERKEEVVKIYEDSDFGRLIIKSYPTGSATINTIRSHIEKLLLKSFVPNLIIIDYADIMRSTRKYDSMRHELKLIYEEIRNLAMDLNLPIWTASQANRDSANSNIVGLENMSEAYGKAMVADVVISLSRKASEKATGEGRLFIAKNRAGRDGILFPINIDTSRSKIKILDEEHMTVNEAMESSKNSMKDLLKKKWQEINEQ
jgi:replicative DNA helicase